MPARVAISSRLPESRTSGAPSRSWVISMLRQGIGTSSEVCRALKTASLAARRAAKCRLGWDFALQ